MLNPAHPDPATVRQMRRAMRLSLAVGVLMLAGKTGAFVLTGSAAILSDAAESVVHVVAVGFAAFSLRLSLRPADERYRYGYERISYFSAGFEGALIVLAAVFIITESVRRLAIGARLDHVGIGTLVVLAAALFNVGLGWYLVVTGKRNKSLILEANGRHVLTDSWTSFGVVGGLGLVLWTGWQPFDPICAILVAANILWSGGGLVLRSIGGLMDRADPTMAQRLRDALDAICRRAGVRYHGLRFRNTGVRTLVDVHVLFPEATPVGEAHAVATAIEHDLCEAVSEPLEVVTHLESIEDHADVHPDEHDTRV